MHFRLVKARSFVAAARRSVPILVGAGGLSVFALTSVAARTAPQEACQQIRATLLRRYVAYGQHDAKAYMALYTPNFVEVLQTGKLFKYASFREDIFRSFSRPGGAPYPPYWCEYKILRCHLSDGQATVDALITVGNPVYRRNSRQVDHYFYGDGHVIDLWQKTGGGWAIEHRKEIYFRTQVVKYKRRHLL